MRLVDDIESVDPLVMCLSDGGWHSGPSLARTLGVTRSAISARIARLRRDGVDIYSVSGKGYRLAAPLDLLDADTIRAGLGERSRAMLDQLLLYQRTDSTNSRVAAHEDGATRACLAEQQTAGRGRGGRNWISPFATNLYLSVGHTMASSPAPFGALSLAVGIRLAETLSEAGLDDISLKWPNDLWVGGAKLGGILIEARGEASGCTRLVAGLGMNVGMSLVAGHDIEQPWTRLADHLAPLPSRSHIAGLCLEAVLDAIDGFERAGFAAFADRWPRFDLTADQPVEIIDSRGRRSAIARGVGADGSLSVEIDGRRQALYSGDVSLRPAG